MGTAHWQAFISTHAQAWEAANEAAQPCCQSWLVSCALQELLANAIEHGMLGIAYAEKQRFLAKGLWQQELQRRAQRAAAEGCGVQLKRAHAEQGWVFDVIDEGAGFDWRAWQAGLAHAEPDPTAASGRGLRLIAQLLPESRLTFLDNGHHVRLWVPTKKAVDTSLS